MIIIKNDAGYERFLFDDVHSSIVIDYVKKFIQNKMIVVENYKEAIVSYDGTKNFDCDRESYFHYPLKFIGSKHEVWISTTDNIEKLLNIFEFKVEKTSIPRDLKSLEDKFVLHLHK